MLLTGVDLGGDYQRGTATVHGLSLLFTVDGITVQGPEPGAERLMAWSGLSSASCRARARQGDGTTAMVLILQAGPQTVRFFLPGDKVTAGQAAYLDQALPVWLSRYGGASAGADVSGPIGPSVPPTPGPTSPPTPSPTAPATAPAPPTPPIPPAPPTPPTPPIAPSAPLTAPAPPAPLMQPIDPGPPPTNSRPFLKRRTLFVVVGTLVAALIAAGVYFATNDSGTAAVSTTTTPGTAPSADQQLVDTVNLRLSDLPSGFARVPPIGSSLTPAQKRSQTRAVNQFADCLGMSQTFIGGLFGNLTQTDQTAAGDSPTFASATTPTTIAQSHTTAVKTPADATADAVPFTKPNFTSCFGHFQNASVAGQVSGGSATVTAVPLFAPTGVGVYGYLTASVLPGHGTVLTDTVFMIGGRTETGLTVQTTATAVSTDVLDSAYTGMVQRIADQGRT
jgi:hypothetical protein